MGAVVVMRVVNIDDGLSCSIARCRTVDYSELGPGGNCSKARCSACHDGFRLFTDDAGEYCGPQCPSGEGCAEVRAPPRHVEHCADLDPVPPCGACSAGFELLLHPKTLKSLGTCVYTCTFAQLGAGCAPQACHPDGSCSSCAPGFGLVNGPGSSNAFLRSSRNVSICEKANKKVLSTARTSVKMASASATTSAIVATARHSGMAGASDIIVRALR